MAKVSIEVNGRRFALGCDEGEQAHLIHLGEQLDKRVQILADQFGQIGDLRLLLMAGITLLDELEDVSGSVDVQAEELAANIRKASEEVLTEAREKEISASESLIDAAQRIERLAGRLAGDP